MKRKTWNHATTPNRMDICSQKLDLLYAISGNIRGAAWRLGLL